MHPRTPWRRVQVPRHPPILDLMERVISPGVLYRSSGSKAKKAPRRVAFALIGAGQWGIRADFDGGDVITVMLAAGR